MIIEKTSLAISVLVVIVVVWQPYLISGQWYINDHESSIFYGNSSWKISNNSDKSCGINHKVSDWKCEKL